MTIEPSQAHTVCTRPVLAEMHKAGRITKSKGARNITHWRLAEGTE